MVTMTFGEFFKQKRVELGKTLRQFCLENTLDAGNISKLERGKLSPPHTREKLEEYAAYLKIKKGTDDWYTFFDLAQIGTGKIPDEILNDASIAATLPMLFRTLRGKKISNEKLDALIKVIRET